MPLSKPIPVLNVDGTPNKNGTITHYTWRHIKQGLKSFTTRLLVTALGKETVILGLPWLKRLNPTINWKDHTVTINWTSTVTTLAQQVEKPKLDLMADMPLVYSPFHSLFEKKAAAQLPEHQPYDHATRLLK